MKDTKDKKNEEEKSIKFFIKKGINSSISTAIVTSIIFPLENLKTRFQLQKALKDDFFINKLYDLTNKIYKEEGINGFYVGYKPYILYNMLSNGIFMLFNELFKKKFKNNILLSSYLAAVINILLTTPFSVLANYMIYNSKNKINISMGDALKQIIRKNGFKGLYTGLLISLILVINPSINYTLYSKFQKLTKNKIKENYSNLISGIGSKIIATLITYPYQTIKVNQQGKTDKKISIINTILLIIMKKGLKGFYDGAQIKIIETALKNGLFLMIYEILNKK